ncbi:MAG: hypothetical protein MJ181_11430 [Treponema sp.]|nr:hypothetical protein [Treponema sp.]
MNEFFLVLIIIALLGIIFFAFRYGIKKNNELKDLQNKIKTEENERKKKDEAKNSMYTGDSVTDFNNSIKQLQNLKKSK